MVCSAGVEPTLSAPEANVLSTGLRAPRLTAAILLQKIFDVNFKNFCRWGEVLFPRITKEFIKKNNFEENQPTDEEIYFRPKKGMRLPPSEQENLTTLKIKFLELFMKHYKNNFAKLEVDCFISEASMRKYLSGDRRITREVIAKFCVGTKLSLEQSSELFTLQGHSLEPENQRLDALIVNALQDDDDINIFFDTCDEYKIKIF